MPESQHSCLGTQGALLDPIVVDKLINSHAIETVYSAVPVHMYVCTCTCMSRDHQVHVHTATNMHVHCACAKIVHWCTVSYTLQCISVSAHSLFHTVPSSTMMPG